MSAAAELIERIRENVPGVLRDVHAWLLHDSDKTPIYANGANRNGALDSEQDRAQLVPFDEAAAALKRNRRASGLGIALGEVPSEDLQIVGIDLDDCYRNDELDPRAAEILLAANSYAEKSPSGRGLHILGTGDIGTLKIAKGDAPGLELYSGSRYFTVTGQRINGAHVTDISEAGLLARRLFGADLNQHVGIPTPAQSDAANTVLNAIKTAGLYLRPGKGKHLIRCPWEARHSPNADGKRNTSSSEAAYFEPGAVIDGKTFAHGLFKCQHSHCDDRKLKDLREFLGLQKTDSGPLDAIRVAIRADLDAGASAIDSATPPRWIVPMVLPVAGANFAGPGGTGKTAAVMAEKVRITCGGALYGREVEMQGVSVLVTAEDGAAYARYVLQQMLQDGLACGQLPERAAAHAKADIRIIGWHRATYGPIVQVDQLGEMRRAPVYDLLLEMLASVRPVYVTLDPAVLFGPGERYGNDGDAYLAAMLHETALNLGACVQMIDHVAQSVARTGIIDQYAARGGTAKTDNARLARQLVRITPDAAENLALPLSIAPEDIAAGRILQLHTTKSNYAPMPPPAWLRRRRFWIEYLRAPNPDEAADRQSQERDLQVIADTAIVVQYVRDQLALGDGIRHTQRDLEDTRPADGDGQPLPRQRVRAAVRRAIATGLLKWQDLPIQERRGQRQTYLAPAPRAAE